MYGNKRTARSNLVNNCMRRLTEAERVETRQLYRERRTDHGQDRAAAREHVTFCLGWTFGVNEERRQVMARTEQAG